MSSLKWTKHQLFRNFFNLRYHPPPARVPQSTKLLCFNVPRAYNLWHKPSLLSQSNLILIISSHRVTDSQCWRIALRANSPHNLLIHWPSSPFPPELGLVSLPGEHRMKNWAHITILPASFLLGVSCPEDLHSALLPHKLIRAASPWEGGARSRPVLPVLGWGNISN